MRIFVDADSCPQQVRDIVGRAAIREGLECLYAANRKIPIMDNELLSMIVVEKGEGVADRYIVDNAEPGDIAVTRDIPLADSLVSKGIVTVNDRGDIFTPENIKQRLSIRNLMQDFREIGIMPEKESRFGPKDVQLFANAFDRELRKLTALNKKKAGS